MTILTLSNFGPTLEFAPLRPPKKTRGLNWWKALNSLSSHMAGHIPKNSPTSGDRPSSILISYQSLIPMFPSYQMVHGYIQKLFLPAGDFTNHSPFTNGRSPFNTVPTPRCGGESRVLGPKCPWWKHWAERTANICNVNPGLMNPWFIN